MLLLAKRQRPRQRIMIMELINTSHNVCSILLACSAAQLRPASTQVGVEHRDDYP